ncbi:MAG: N-6 DNA methylase [Nitrospirae bacterium]|nr:N-6 DNA methylase [Nitrospirota bacterium]
MTAGRSLNTQSQEWGTPKKYAEAVRSFFGGQIALDPCSNEYSIVQAGTEYRLPHLDGLKESWDFPTIYVNPPYGVDKVRGTSIKEWLLRCAYANQMYNSEVLALVPVATNTGHWKRYVFGAASGVCFLYDTRLKFLVNGLNGGKGAPMSCAMIYWGVDFDRFFSFFSKFGAALDLRSLKGNNGI